MSVKPDILDIGKGVAMLGTAHVEKHYFLTGKQSHKLK